MEFRIVVASFAMVLAAGLCAVVATPEAANAEVISNDLEHPIVKAYRDRFQIVDTKIVDELEDLYREDIRFSDPITSLEGIESLETYLAHFAKLSAGARFTVEDAVVREGTATVLWRMEEAGTSDGGRVIPGVSILRFDDRIYEQRDYFDVGAALYERIPLVGALLQRVKARLVPESIR